MNKSLSFVLLPVLLAVPMVSSAAFINLDLTNSYQVVAAGSATTLTFSGTVDVLAGFDVSGGSIELAFNQSSSALTSVSYDIGFVSYVNGNNPGVGYAGTFFTITLSGTEAVGLYAFNNGTGGDDDLLSEIYLRASNGTITAKDSELYAVEVVPEPASMAALAVGAAALLRKRRK